MLFLMFFACSVKNEDTESGTKSDTILPTPEWYGDIEPIITKNCATCHQNEGAAPFSLTTYEEVEPLAEIVWNSIASGSMPPWLPDPDCRSYKNERYLTQDEKDMIQKWVEEGTPMGDPALGVSELPEIPTLDANLMTSVPEGFVPDTSAADQYRCFITDVDIQEPVYLQGSHVIAGSPQVHHVLVYAVDKKHRETIQGFDAQDDVLGYSCFGSPYPDGASISWLEGFPTQIGAWVPALGPIFYPQNTAIRIEKGSLVIMQVHYSALGGQEQIDSTQFLMKTTTEEPEFLLTTKPLAIQDLDIPAGNPNVEVRDVFTNFSSKNIELAGISAHMHLIGKEQVVTEIHSDGTEECVLDIPDWDFNWQQAYRLLDDERVVVEPLESLELMCGFDNSQENQPIVNGEQKEPTDVEWGDGTLDEMCLAYMTLVEPFRPPKPDDASECYGYEECLDNCGRTAECFLTCENVDLGCHLCAVEETYDCALFACPLQSLAAEDCLYTCFRNNLLLGGTLGTCMQNICPTEYENWYACAAEKLEGEDCREPLQNCGIEF